MYQLYTKKEEEQAQKDVNKRPRPHSSAFSKRKYLVGSFTGMIIVVIFVFLLVFLRDKKLKQRKNDISQTINRVQAYENLRFAVKSLKLVNGSSDIEAIAKCTDGSSSSWVVTGVNWVIQGDACLFLCQERIPLPTNTTEGSKVLKRLVIFEDADACTGPNMMILGIPRPNVIICQEYIDIVKALETRVFVSDILTTSAEFYNNDRPGWKTLPTSIHKETLTLNSSSDDAGVYLSYLRPSLSITNLNFVTAVTLAEAWALCSNRDSETTVWEPAGSGYVESTDGKSVGLVCVQLEHLNGSNDNRRGLIDIYVAKDYKDCTENRVALPVPSMDSAVMCLSYGDVFTNVSIGDLAIVRSASKFEGKSLKKLVPGKWIPDPLDLNGRDWPIYLFWRKTQYYIPMDMEELSEETEPKVNDTMINLVLTAKFASTNDASLQRRPPLQARNTKDGSLTFKILQLADLHYTGDADFKCSDAPGVPDSKDNCTEATMTQFINDLLDVEKPDFVVFTGDNVDIRDPMKAEKALKMFSQVVEDRQIPWSMVLGNHDDDSILERNQMFEYISSLKYSYVERGPKEVDGVGNFDLAIQAPTDGTWGKQGDQVFRMYFLDSHGERREKKYPLVDSKYEWIKPSQIEFYKSRARSYASKKLPAVMFFHIPLPEFALAGDEAAKEKNEPVYAPSVNTGFFNALVEMGDVKATFVGHDHLNHYCYKREGIHLCYGGGTGLGAAYGEASINRRARVIEYSIDQKKRYRIQTWERLHGLIGQKKDIETLYDEAK